MTGRRTNAPAYGCRSVAMENHYNKAVGQGNTEVARMLGGRY